MLAGVAYAIGYLALLKAWETVPSTVIVPCLQLSSPMVEIMEAALAHHHAAHPLLAPLRGESLSMRTCAAFLIVFIGGMMASVGEGSLAELCSLKLWRKRSMLWMMVGNLAFSLYCARARPTSLWLATEHAWDPPMTSNPPLACRVGHPRRGCHTVCVFTYS